MANNKRIEWIDVAKALAIILVGIGHYSCPEGLKTWIYTFHMPLFFMLSGFTLNVTKDKFTNFITKRIKSLIVPWIIAVIFNSLFQNLCLALSLSAPSVPIYSIPARILFNWRISFEGIYDPIYWFLPCLFLTQILLYVLLRYFNSKKRQVILMAILIGIAYAYEYSFNLLLPWEIDILPIICLYVLIGYFMRTHYEEKFASKGNIKEILFGLGLLVIGSVLGFGNKYYAGYIPDINSGRYGVIFLAVTAAILSSIGIMLLTKIVHCKLINYIGQNSLMFYLLQPFMYKIVDLTFCVVLPFYAYASNALNLILLHIGTNIGILLYVFVYKKIKSILLYKRG